MSPLHKIRISNNLHTQLVCVCTVFFTLYLAHSALWSGSGASQGSPHASSSARFCDNPNSFCIFDIGHHQGKDTRSYLQIPNARVVAVEANPLLARALRDSLSSAVSSKRLILRHVGIAKEGSENRKLYFWLNKYNSQMSSFVEWRACRAPGHRMVPKGDHTYCASEQVETTTCGSLVREYGTPRYMKIDIEGLDTDCLRSLASLDKSQRPTYVSKEGVYPVDVDVLESMGYVKFKIVNQRGLSYGLSGPWGEQAHDIVRGKEWHSAAEIRKFMPWKGVKFDGTVNGVRIAGWFDLHASRV